MKTIRSLVILAGFSVALVALGPVGARAQIISKTDFGGTFTFPVSAQWGAVALPAGHYTLRYGSLNGSDYVEVRGTAKASVHGVIQVSGNDRPSASKNELICVREGSVLVVRMLEMPAIGESARFALPRGVQLVAHKRNGYTNTLLAGGPMLIERIPMTLNQK